VRNKNKSSIKKLKTKIRLVESDNPDGPWTEIPESDFILTTIGRGYSAITNLVDTDKLSGENNLDLDTWQAKAIALAFEHRDWSGKKIAEELGIKRQTLYKDKQVASALKARNKQKRPDKKHYPKGQKETGDLEAWR